MAAEPTPIERPTAALDAVIREQNAASRMREDLEGYLRGQGVQGADLEEMVSVGAERMLVYRQLVHNRHRNATRDFITCTAARLGRSRYGQDMDAFIACCGARSPYLRDVPAEFVAWVLPRWEADPEIPGYIPDLARHELLALDVRNDWRGNEGPTELALALDRPLRFDGAAKLVHYRYAVHRLPREASDRSEPDEEPTRLLVYRDEHHKVRYLELTPFAAALLHELMMEHRAVQPALEAACEALGEPLDDDKLGSAVQLFTDLGERGVYLGAEPG